MVSLLGVDIEYPPILDSITGFPEGQSTIRIYWMVRSVVKSYSQQKHLVLYCFKGILCVGRIGLLQIYLLTDN